MTQIRLKKPNKIRNLGMEFLKKINKKEQENNNKKKEPKWDKKSKCNKIIMDEIERLINQEKDKTQKKTIKIIRTKLDKKLN